MLERFIEDWAGFCDSAGRSAEAMWYRCQVQELAIEWERTGRFPRPTGVVS